MVDEADKLYLRASMAGNLDRWHPIKVQPDFITTYNFTDYNYRINGVTYFQDCPEFHEAMEKLILWAKVRGTWLTN